MQLGISSWAYQWLAGRPNHPPDNPLTPIGLLNKANELGVKVIQIAENIPLHKCTDTEIQAFYDIAQQYGICIEVGTVGIEPSNLAQYLRLAKRLNCDLVRTNFQRPKNEKEVTNAIQNLKSIMTYYESANIKLAIENYDNFPTQEMVDIIRAVDSTHIGTCLDPGNSLSCNEGTEHVTDVLAPLALSLHVKDIAIFREPYNMGFIVEGRACGQGQIDLPHLINRTKKETDHDINAILECWTPWQGSLEASLQVEDKWIEDSIHYLRTLIPN